MHQNLHGMPSGETSSRLRKSHCPASAAIVLPRTRTSKPRSRTSDIRQNLNLPRQRTQHSWIVLEGRTCAEPKSYVHACTLCLCCIKLTRSPQNCMTWMSQVLDGNPLTSYAVVFLEAAGFDEVQTFDINISISACFVIGVLICYLLFPFFGRKTIYLSGLCSMFVLLIIVSLSSISCTSSSQILTWLRMKDWWTRIFERP